MPKDQPAIPSAHESLDQILHCVDWSGRSADSIAITGADPVLPTNFRIGTALTAGIGFFQAKQSRAHELDLRRLDMAMARFEAKAAEKTAAIAAESAESAAAWAGMAASYKEAGARWSAGDSKWLVFVDMVRGLTRPLPTWFLVITVGVIYFTLGESDIETLDLKPRIIDSLVYLATTCILWWFGARQVAKVVGGGGRA